MRYSFRNTGGTLVTVVADDENRARFLAMVKLHGPVPPPVLGIIRWTGTGLDLIAADA